MTFFFFLSYIIIVFSFLKLVYKTLYKLYKYNIYFFKKYIYTINHKKIALNYFYFSLWSGLLGTLLALFIRLELAHPGSTFFKGNSLLYLQTITAHGIIMIFFVVVPIIFGCFGNLLIPYHIGSKDVAYPRLNSIGFWILPSGFLLICKSAFLRPKLWKYYDIVDKYQSFFNNNLLNDNNLINIKNYSYNTIIDKSLFLKNFYKLNLRQYWWDIIFFPENLWYSIENINFLKRNKLSISKSPDGTTTSPGWTMITPYSSSTKYTSTGPTDLLILSLIFAGITTTIGFVNLLVTRRTLSMPGLVNRRFLLPFFTISILLTLRVLVLITPVVASCFIMIFSDRHWHTTFFDFAYGGDPILSQHLFWFFGHPEVYVMVIPSFGVINMVIPYCSYRRVNSKQHMIWALYVMAYMGFLVWGHHMYLVGLDHRSRTLYSTITIMISLPATIKIMSWVSSLLNSGIYNSPYIFIVLNYFLFFLVSGLTGMWLSHLVLNMNTHDTYYVIAHFHFMLSATTMLGLFLAVYYYFNVLFGLKLSTNFIWAHLINFVIGHWFTFLPQFFLGTSGMPRRIHDYPVIFIGWNSLSTSGTIITIISLFFFFLVILDSFLKEKISNIRNIEIIPRLNNQINYLLYSVKELNKYKLYDNKYLTSKSNIDLYLLYFNISINKS